MAPVAPKTVTFMGLAPGSVGLWCTRGDAGNGRGRTVAARAMDGSAGDEDLAEGAVGEGRKCLGRTFQRDGRLDVDPKPTVGDPLEQCGQFLSGGGSHDGSQRDV